MTFAFSPPAQATGRQNALRLVCALTLCVTLVSATPPAAGWLRGLRPKEVPVRLVSLAPSVTQMLFELGLGDHVVGVTRYCDQPAAAKALPKVGGFSDPSLEAVMALHPQAVVAVPSEANQKVVERLLDLGVPVLLVPATTLAHVFAALDLLGKELGAAARAQQVSAQLHTQLEAVSQRVKQFPPVRVLIMYDHKPLVVAGPGSFAAEILPLAGGINVVDQGAVAYPTLSLETVARLRPDVVVDASMGAVQNASNAAALEVLGRLPMVPAVKNHRVHTLPSGTLMRPGSSIGHDVEMLARLLHPQAFDHSYSGVFP